MKLLFIIIILVINKESWGQVRRPVTQVQVRILKKDTILKVTIYAAKLQEFKRKGVSLEKTAGNLLNHYHFENQNAHQNKSIERIEYPNSFQMKVIYTDGTSKIFNQRNTSGGDDKADNVSITFPDPPAYNSPLDVFAKGVNKRLGETLGSLLSTAVWNSYQASERTRQITIYQQISQRVDLISSLKRN